MNFIKKQTAGICVTFVTLILAIISFIIYNVNINSAGYFQHASSPNAVRYMLIAIVLFIAAIVIGEIPVQGIADKIITLLADAARIVAPALCLAAAITLISSRVQGFAFIYFSNEEVLQEVQTASNMASSHGAIASIVALFIAAIVGMVAAFFSLKKKAA